ncbi:MAG: DUF2199 domain-containing protein [Pseudomonadota bacterium]
MESVYRFPKITHVFEFRCRSCGEVHKGSPSIGYAKPAHYYSVPEAERAHRVLLTSDTCAIDNDTYFVRGVMEIPIRGVDAPFTWGLWVSLSHDSFQRYLHTFHEDQTGTVSFGWLPVTMRGYFDPTSARTWDMLATDVVGRGPGNRPLIVPHKCDHPVYRDYAQGMDWDRAVAIAERALHG